MGDLGRRGGLPAAALFALALGSAAAGVQDSTPPPAGGEEAPVPEFVRQRCGSCHAVPAPSRLPRDQWTATMELMKNVMKEQAAVEYSAQDIQRILIYYRSNSPSRLPVLPPIPASSPLAFETRSVGIPPPSSPADGPMPTISNVRVTDLDSDGANDVLVCDALGNRVSWIHRRGETWEETTLAEVPAPAGASVVDLDRDGDPDIVVAALGSLFPTNERTGRVVALVNDGSLTFTPQILLEDVGRVADAVPGDLDGDGDIDVAVGVFGHITLGGIGWLERLEDGSFSFHWLLEQPGGLNVPVADLDGDGDLDILGMVAQAAERVVEFVNDGKGNFSQQTVFEAGTPSFGSSGMRLVDLDRDGDLDALHTNGDAFDVVGKQVPMHFFQRPYHGVRWIENLGGQRWATHEIHALYGAFGAAAGDLDGDGDMDVFAVSMFNDWNDPLRQSAIWFENDGAQRFTAHGLGNSPTHQVTADLGDLDGDGRLDAVTGGMHVLPPFDRLGRVTLWRNLGAGGEASAALTIDR